ncbi:Cytochrome c heme lyase subunit CcmF [hydrothermal vent metagenome]|uniref:Cytochrome c heme lyase subunit CcmF n=1 Tax=hydrothermal vent metagenome TaxID=652676 RepID=A0A3B1B2A9_9ZZZZ
MIAELGHYFLVLALGLTVIQAIFPMIGAARGSERMMMLGQPAAYGQFFFCLLAFLALTYSYLISDFSVSVVARNSHSLKPLLYKISGVWGNHEGSLLFWVMFLALFGAMVAYFGRGLPKSLRARVLSVQAMVGIGFYLFMLLTSNPFDRLSDVPFEGNGLNPLLQDPGLVFHPPFLYLGYVGLSVVFSFAIAALIEGRVDPAWARWVRPWTLLAWIFLTIGIVLGSWWAYYELGWGGWWAWDPVENASFMPWLVATALLHSAIVVEKRDTLKSWTILLAIIAFSFSLLGTFIVRSGIITSVHAFATDPERGLYILVFLALVIGGSFLLFAIRSDKLQAGGLFAPISRESGLMINNLFLSVAAAVVLYGTMHPLLSDAFFGVKSSVGAPFFNLVFSLLMIPLVVTMVYGPHLKWKRADIKGISQRLMAVTGIALLAALMTFYATYGGAIMPVIWIGIGVWLLLSTLQELASRIKLFQTPFKESMSRLKRQPRSSWGMTLGHFGFAVGLLGIVGTSAWTIEAQKVMGLGEDMTIGGYRLTLKDVIPVAGPNYTAVRGIISVSPQNSAENGESFMAYPETRTYVSSPITTTEGAVKTTMAGDLFIVIGESQGQGRWGIRAYYKPMQVWFWIGTIIVVLGGLISLSDRRYRIGTPQRQKASGKRKHAP